MELAKLVLRCLLVIAGTGALAGGVSALICPEAFTLGRPPSFGNLPAPLLGWLWGLLDFLMPGIVVGLAVGFAANTGGRPAVKAMFYRKPLRAHAALMLGAGILAGVIGWIAVTQAQWYVLGAVAAAVPPERHPALGAIWWASRGVHLGNLAGGVTLAIWTWKKRAEFDAEVKARRG
jgi:hypothetical protein